MMCKFCGMDSATTDVCSWCGKPLHAVQPAPAPPAVPEPASQEESFAPEENFAEDFAQDETNAAPFAGRSLSAPPLSAAPLSAPPPSPPAAPNAGNAGAGGTGRKFAPAMPPPPTGKLRAPAPAAPLPPGRSAAPTPPLNAEPSAAVPPRPSLNDMASAAPLTGETFSGRAPEPPASPAPALTQQAEPLNVPSLMPQASAPAPPLSAAITPDVPARPLQATAQNAAIPESAIGTGVSPQRVFTDAPAPAAATAPDEKQRKAAVDAALADSGPSPMQLLTRYLGVFGVIALVTGLLAFIAKPFYVAPMLIAMFAAAMLLPILHVTEWADEDTDDVIWFVLLTLLFGPLVALVIYGVVAVARQDFNPSVLGCLAVAAVLRVVGEVASGGIGVVSHLIQTTSPFSSIGNIGAGLVKNLLLNWSGFAALAGWFAAGTFHKEDE